MIILAAIAFIVILIKKKWSFAKNIIKLIH